MKIGLVGTMSVGKSTLAKALGEIDRLKDHSVQTERSKYLRDLGIPLNTDSTLPGQLIFLAERASEILRNKVLTDRTVWDVCSFTLQAKSIEELYLAMQKARAGSTAYCEATLKLNKTRILVVEKAWKGR